MATKFLEPGGDATFDISLWPLNVGAPTVVSDFVHGNHIKSIRYRPSTINNLQSGTGILADTGSRISFYIYLVALPTATRRIFRTINGGSATVFQLQITTGGILQLFESTVQIGINGTHTLATGQWYRISLAYTITDTTHNRFELFVDGASDISITNATTTNTGTTQFILGIFTATDTNFDYRSSDHYIDDSSSLTDTGDIWVTAKRPNANGTLNEWTTQIGSGGSGYGSGHSPQINERPLSITNGWQEVGLTLKTEEYNIESQTAGDIDITATVLAGNLLKEDGFVLLQEDGTKILLDSPSGIIDYMGWVYASSTGSETATIIVNGVSSNISLTTTNTMFTKMASSKSYPNGTGTDIGIESPSVSILTESLYECGIVVAFIYASIAAPSPVVATSRFDNLLLLGVS